MEETAFDSWFFENWDTLVKMYESFQSECPDADMELHEFICEVYDDGQDIVESWDEIEAIKAIPNN